MGKVNYLCKSYSKKKTNCLAVVNTVQHHILNVLFWFDLVLFGIRFSLLMITELTCPIKTTKDKAKVISTFGIKNYYLISYM